MGIEGLFPFLRVGGVACVFAVEFQLIPFKKRV
jgi:hypothetical protein